MNNLTKIALVLAMIGSSTAYGNVYKTNDSEATDEARKLVWSRCLVGQTYKDNGCTGTPTEFKTWEDALNAQKTHVGWRVPNIKELASVVADKKANPAVDDTTFLFAKAIKSDYLWSSTPLAAYQPTQASKDTANRAHYLDLSNGEIKDNNRDGSNTRKKWYVLLVKDKK